MNNKKLQDTFSFISCLSNTIHSSISHVTDILLLNTISNYISKLLYSQRNVKEINNSNLRPFKSYLTYSHYSNIYFKLKSKKELISNYNHSQILNWLHAKRCKFFHHKLLLKAFYWLKISVNKHNDQQKSFKVVKHDINFKNFLSCDYRIIL